MRTKYKALAVFIKKQEVSSIPTLSFYKKLDLKKRKMLETEK